MSDPDNLTYSKLVGALAGLVGRFEGVRFIIPQDLASKCSFCGPKFVILDAHDELWAVMCESCHAARPQASEGT